ncbi:MAG: hypothetical protein ACREI3_01485 [Nitrospirales bacterium]
MDIATVVCLMMMVFATGHGLWRRLVTKESRPAQAEEKRAA